MKLDFTTILNFICAIWIWICDWIGNWISNWFFKTPPVQDEIISQSEPIDFSTANSSEPEHFPPHYYANNCLFEAMIDAFNKNGKWCPVKLRQECNRLMIIEGFPLIEFGKPAGEGYLNILSKLFKVELIARFSGSNNKSISQHIRHSDVAENCEQVKLLHTGSRTNGHWQFDRFSDNRMIA